MTQFHVKFKTEYICLKCLLIQDEKADSCPRCGGPMCPRIIREW